jgi:hypothetical protein
LKQSGIFGLIEILVLEHDSGVPLSLNPRASRSIVGKPFINTAVSSLASLDKFLITAGFDSQSLLSKMSSLPLMRKVSQMVLVCFLEKYKGLVKAVLDPKNKYEFPTSLLSRTVDEVETLLSLHSDYEPSY